MRRGLSFAFVLLAAAFLPIFPGYAMYEMAEIEDIRHSIKATWKFKNIGNLKFLLDGHKNKADIELTLTNVPKYSIEEVGDILINYKNIKKIAIEERVFKKNFKK